MLLATDRLLGASGEMRPGWLVVDGELITEVGDGAPPRRPDVDWSGRSVVPGFVDIHCHGGGGAGFQLADPDEVAAAASFHRLHGVTTVVASLVSAPVDELEVAVGKLRGLVDAGVVGGVHLEGPWLSEARCGAHDPAYLRPPDPGDVARLLAAGAGAVRMVTLAPELPGGLDAVRQVVAAGVVAAVGHTDAAYEAVRDAIAAGATVATHLHNGMPPVHHRAPGPIIACLEDPRMTIELIADNVHLHPAIVHHDAASAPGRLALVSDAIPAAGAGDGTYLLGHREVTVRGGKVRLVAADTLAGSTLTLDVAVRNAVTAGLPVEAAVAAVTSGPADALGLGDRVGRLLPGRRADLVVLDDDLSLVQVLAGGRPQLESKGDEGR
ncbi:MAG TPA: N-acetylglucosamine-6-phosphate deacetylase [Acidimicrobiales bacterium]|nr:N-acetylglucosamine-6-phosphate deacetylase [Acidimicrobiales bacterium]